MSHGTSNYLGVLAKTRNFCHDPLAIWRRPSFVTLAFRNELEYHNFDFSRVIGIHFCTPRRNLVQRPRSLRHRNLYRWRRMGWPLLFALAFDKVLADHKSDFKSFNGDNQATLCTNLVNFRPVISGVFAVKARNFVVIRQQFDDDLHSSGWRFQTVWKIAILISAE